MSKVAMGFDARAYLEKLAQSADENIELAFAAIAIATLSQPDIHPERFFNHLDKLKLLVAENHAALLQQGETDDVNTRLRALQEVMVIDQGYEGDQKNYDDLQNADLIRVIERRKGLPIALCILYIHAARSQGWEIAGLNLPGHFVCRLEKDGERLIFDPFHSGRILQAPDLRQIVKQTAGPQAELSAAYFEPATNRDILIRLQNNIKYRLIDAEDYEAALKIVDVMRLIAPEEYRLLLDAGVLSARTERPRAAIDFLEDYIRLAPADRDRQEAAILLQQLKESLN